MLLEEQQKIKQAETAITVKNEFVTEMVLAEMNRQ